MQPRIQKKAEYEKAHARLVGATESRIRDTTRLLLRTDLFYLLMYGLGRKDIDNDWLYDRCVEVQNNPNGHVDLWARTHYKENLLTEDILTPDGWKKFGDLRVGDKVFSPNGNPVSVLALGPIQSDPYQYSIKFSNYVGSTQAEVIAGSQHLWDVIGLERTPAKDYDKEMCVDTDNLFRHTQHQKNCVRKRWYRVKTTEPIQYPEKDLPVDPYVLGSWLGDGSCGSGTITNCSEEMINRIRDSYDIGTVREVGNTKVFTPTGLVTSLKKLGLFNVSSSAKFIPKEYFTTSVEQRVALVQGLMDTDGHVAKSGNLKYHTTSKRLKDGFVELLIGMGVFASVCQSKTPQGKDFYVVSFSQSHGIDFVSIPKHIKRLSKRKLDYSNWYIKDVERVESKPARCIQVEGGKYLIGKMLIPTHNSTIITFAKTIQDILSSHGDNPLAEWKGLELTSCILSHTNPIAVAFLSQIKYELETNVRLKFAFPDILYQEPQKEAPMWSLEKGIVVKRKSNPREATVEASGLVDGQPISKHFMLRVYDDVVTDRSVTTTEQIKKTTAAWELSLNLGTQDISLERYIGTRYHFNDTWAEIIKRNAAIPRIYPATDDGKLHGNPVLLSKEALMSIREKQGPYIFSCQQLLNPTADDLQGFKLDWVKTYLKVDHSQFNNYILVDSAGSKKRKENDWTTMLVIGAGIDRKLYLVDAVRDRFNLTERTQCLFRLHDKYKPLDIGYEEYGLQADIEHIEYVQEEKNYRFNITPLGGSTPKEIRIRGLVPYFENKLIYLPATLPYRNYEGKLTDLIKYFIDEEYLAFPVSKWDDFIDCFARIADNDMKISYPVVEVRKAAPTQAEEDWNIIWGSSDEGQNVFYLDD